MYRWSSDDHRSDLRILQELVDIFHVPVNEEWQHNGRGYTFLDTFSTRELPLAFWHRGNVPNHYLGRNLSFILKTLDKGGEITNFTLPNTSTSSYVSIFSRTTISRILPHISNHLNHPGMDVSNIW